MSIYYYNPITQEKDGCFRYYPTILCNINGNQLDFSPIYFSPTCLFRASLRQQHVVPVIIQFNDIPLLQRFPDLNKNKITNHPYIKELRQRYSGWLQQIKQHIPHLQQRFTFDTFYPGISAYLPRTAIPQLRKFPFLKMCIWITHYNQIDLDRVCT